ncbi:MAG: ABC transporter ATP-binding protein [Desulfovibrionaceae bacterium]
MIELRDVHAGYGRREVLCGVDLRLAPGEFVGLLGPNGSGKTTLLLTLCRVLPCRSGRIAVHGRDIHSLQLKTLATYIASVPQRFGIPDGLPVRSLVLMGRYAHLDFLAGYGPEDEAAADQALREAGVADLADRRAGELSGGELQRVLLARALAQQTPALLLDEAVANLDVAARVQVCDRLAAQAARGVTILAALHDINLAAQYCGRLVFLKHGRVAVDGPTEAVFTSEILRDIYETEIVVAPHPVTGRPQAHVVPGGAGAAGGPALGHGGR